MKQHLHQLKHEDPKKLLLEMQKLQKKYPQAKPIIGNYAYLKKRENQIQYPTFQTQGWPIGSGIVESGNKLVVEARLKGAGMHWAEQHVNPMLALRNIICSERWQEEWSKIEAGIRKQKLKKPDVAPSKVITGDEAVRLIIQEKLNSGDHILEAVLNPKKTKSIPWRNFKFGKSLYQRQDPPKL